MPLTASFVTSSVCLSVCLAVFPQRPERLPCEKRERPEQVCRSGSLFIGAELPSQRLFPAADGAAGTAPLATLCPQPGLPHSPECSGHRLARPAALCCVQGETKPSCKPPFPAFPLPSEWLPHCAITKHCQGTGAGAGLALPNRWCSWRAYKERWESLTSSPL